MASSEALKAWKEHGLAGVWMPDGDPLLMAKAMFVAGFEAGVEHARRTPPPATAELLRVWREQIANRKPRDYLPDVIRSVLDEWPERETPGAGPGGEGA
jgi:hypothetical protein